MKNVRFCLAICGFVLAALGYNYATANSVGILVSLLSLAFMASVTYGEWERYHQRLAACIAAHPAGKGRSL